MLGLSGIHYRRFHQPKIPRRTMFLIGTVGIGLVYIVWTIASSKGETGSRGAVIPVLVFMFLYTLFYSLGWGSLAYTYLSELFPYHQRSQGIVVEHLTGRIALFVNTYVNPIATASIGWKYYLMFCVWIAVEALTVFFFFSETHNRTLEELTSMWEGNAVWARARKRMDEVMAIQVTELGPIKEDDERAGNERDDASS